MERFDLGEELARGRRFVSREARETELESDVTVVDVDLSDLADEGDRASVRAHITTAATALTDLDHENVIRCLDVIDEGDSLRIVFERPEGTSLATLLADGSLPAAASIEVVSQVLAGVHAMNEVGVSSLVVSPESIVLTPDGTAKLGGLFALPGLHEVAVVAPGDLLALVRYLAPEQLDGDAGDVRSVAFSAGLVLLRMLSGTNPFDAGQIPATMYRIKCEPAPGLDISADDIPDYVAPLLVKALAKDPELRYANPEAMRADLVGGVAPDVTAVIAATPIPTVPIATGAVAPVAAKKNLHLPFSAKALALGLIVAILIGGVAFGGYSYMQKKQADDRARQVAIIAEGRVLAGYVSRLKTLRADLAGSLTAAGSKAKMNSAALRAWDSEWGRRQSAYKSRYAAVEAHNTAENERYTESGVNYYYTYGGGFAYTEYTYKPQTWSYPSSPKKPAKVKANLSAEQTRLQKLESELNALRSEIASSTPTSRYFGPVYQELNLAATALSGTVGDARSMMTIVVTQNSEKGAQVDTAKIKAINLGALDAPFQQLDSRVTASLAGFKVPLQMILPETTGTVSAAASATAPAKK